MSAEAAPLDPADAGWLSIAAVERDTGLGKDTLRIWERRYGFPAPHRDAAGERAYPGPQVEKLRVLKRLLDAGHRPGRVVMLELAELNSLSEQSAHRVAPSIVVDQQVEVELQACLESLQVHDLESVRRRLAQAQQRMGIAGFINDLLIPLNTRVGNAWMRGKLEIYQEHAFTELQQIVLRNALAGFADPGIARPRVLLSTLPGEPHALGLLMAEAMFAVDGARCVSLGAQTPIWDLALAAAAYRCDIVALGFSGCMNPNHVVAALTELRGKLAPTISIWTGGSAPVLTRRPVAGVEALSGVGAIHAALREWHRARS